MKTKKMESASVRFFSARTEKKIMISVLIYSVVFIAIQVTRLIIQNL